MNGAGVDVCVCGGLTGETEGTPCVGSTVVVGTGVGSAVGWSQTEYPSLRLELLCEEDGAESCTMYIG